MISIIIPTYNNSSQLLKTINHISLDGIEDYEIIIIDDASTDDTELVVGKLKNSKIKYFKQPYNLGVTLSRVEGIKKSSGDYVGFLDDDDIWLSNKLKKQLDIMTQKNLDFIMSDYIINDMINNISYKKSLRKFALDFKTNIIKNPGPFFQCCLFKKDFLIEHINKFDQSAEPSEDWDFFISISKVGPKVDNVDESMFQWNLSNKSQSSNYYKESCAIEYIIRKHENYIINNSSTSIMTLHYRKLGSMFFYSNKFNQAKQYYSKAFTRHPLVLKNILFKIIYSMPQTIASQIINLFTTKIR